jgi:hypothetical protein
MASVSVTYKPTQLRGRVLVAPYNTPDQLIAIGNVGPLTQNAEVESEDVKNYTSPSGGTWAKFERLESMNLEGTLYDLSATNLARAMKATTTTVGAGSVSTEAHTAWQGAHIRTTKPKPSSVVITCTAPAWAAETDYSLGDMLLDTGTVFECTAAGESGETEPTWQTDEGDTTTDGTVTWTSRGTFAAVADTDFIVRPVGVYIVADAGIPDGCPVNVAYSHPAHVDIVAMGDTSYWRVVFEGLNAKDSNHEVRITYHKCEFDLAESLELIADGMTTLPFNAVALADGTISSGNQIVKVEMIGG